MQLFDRALGEGAPLVILHGLFGAGNNWWSLTRSVFSKRFEVHAVDQRNHGRSPHSDRHDYPAMAADLLELIDQHGWRGANILGHSMGGKAAMQLALTAPERVTKLVVVDISPRASKPTHLRLMDAMMALDVSGLRSRREADEALQAAIPDRAVRLFLLTNLERDDDGGMRWRINLPALREQYTSIMGAIESTTPYEGPALFIRGERSGYIQAQDVEAINALFPRARHVTIEGAGHWVHADAPDALAEVVCEFLEASE